MTGRILPPLSAILPLWLVRSMVGWRETLAVWPALVVSGLSFALTQFYWSNYQESGLVDVVAALVSLLAMVAFLKVWHPATVLAHDPDRDRRSVDRCAALARRRPEGLVAVPARLGLHLPGGPARRRPAPELRRPEAADARAASGRAPGAAGGHGTRPRKTRSPT